MYADDELADVAEWLGPTTDDVVDETMDSVLLRARLDGEPR